ncbi:hypothetical protein Droror1_Dr00025594 [Drosera rotundifolia]
MVASTRIGRGGGFARIGRGGGGGSHGGGGMSRRRWRWWLQKGLGVSHGGATTATSFVTCHRLREIRHHRLSQSLLKPPPLPILVEATISVRSATTTSVTHSQSLMKPPPPPPSRPATTSLRSATTASVTHCHSYPQLSSMVLVAMSWRLVMMYEDRAVKGD